METLACVHGEQAELQAKVGAKFYETNLIWDDNEVLRHLVLESILGKGFLRFLPGMTRAAKGHVSCLSNLGQWVALSNFWRNCFNR
eukprot:GSA25T00013736001.1